MAKNKPVTGKVKVKVKVKVGDRAPNFILSHNKFALKYDLPFTILSDKNGEVRKLYGIPSSLGVLPGGVTYIIDRKGIVRQIFSSQIRVKEHVNKALETLLNIEAEDTGDKKLEIRI